MIAVLMAMQCALTGSTAAVGNEISAEVKIGTYTYENPIVFAGVNLGEVMNKLKKTDAAEIMKDVKKSFELLENNYIKKYSMTEAK